MCFWRGNLPPSRVLKVIIMKDVVNYLLILQENRYSLLHYLPFVARNPLHGTMPEPQAEYSGRNDQLREVDATAQEIGHCACRYACARPTAAGQDLVGVVVRGLRGAVWKACPGGNPLGSSPAKAGWKVVRTRAGKTC